MVNADDATRAHLVTLKRNLKRHRFRRRRRILKITAGSKKEGRKIRVTNYTFGQREKAHLSSSVGQEMSISSLVCFFPPRPMKSASVINVVAMITPPLLVSPNYGKFHPESELAPLLHLLSPLMTIMMNRKTAGGKTEGKGGRRRGENSGCDDALTHGTMSLNHKTFSPLQI